MDRDAPRARIPARFRKRSAPRDHPASANDSLPATVVCWRTVQEELIPLRIFTCRAATRYKLRTALQIVEACKHTVACLSVPRPLVFMAPRILRNLALLVVAISLLTYKLGFSAPAAPNATVVVLKWATHPALNEVEQAFKTEFERLTSSARIPYIYSLEFRNAENNRVKAAEIAESITRSDVALIVTFGTPATQSVVKVRSGIPVLFAAVSDPDGAGITASNRATGIKNVGIDIIRTALQVILSSNPGTKKIGTLYNPAEQNSSYAQGLITAVCAEKGIELIQRRVTDVTKIGSEAEVLADQVDVFYCANDNLVNIGIASLASVTKSKKKLLVIGEVSALNNGATIAVGVDYTETGKALAAMAIEILRGKSATSLPIKEPPPAVVRYNARLATEIGLKLPPDVLKRSSQAP